MPKVRARQSVATAARRSETDAGARPYRWQCVTIKATMKTTIGRTTEITTRRITCKRVFQNFGDSKIHDPNRSVITDHDILRLEITVHNFLFVHMSQGIAERARDLNGVRDWDRPHLVHYTAERATLQKFHHDVWTALISDVNEAQNIGVIQALPDLRFSLKPGKRSRIGFKLHMRHFDCHGLISDKVFGLVDRRHPATAYNR